MIWKNLSVERSVPSDTQQTKEKPMQYLVDMRLVDSGRSTNPQEGLAFVENWIFPTLARCTELQRQGKIVGGGPIGGVIGFALLIEAASVLELDQVIESLPLWPRTHTRVTPLTTFDDRLTAVKERLDGIKARIAAQKLAS
jgi:muconolactone delta-isomerase